MEEDFKNLHLQLSRDDIRKIDEWKIAHGMKSRTEAIRAMIRIATNSGVEEVAGNKLAEYDNNKYIKPDLYKKDTNSIEELVRKMVKEELQKLNNGE